MQGPALMKLKLLFELLYHSAETIMVNMSKEQQIGNVIESVKAFIKGNNV